MAFALCWMEYTDGLEVMAEVPNDPACFLSVP